MESKIGSAPKIAEFLLQIKAVQLNLKEPFQWASGWWSPIYCDNRKTLGYPSIRTFIRQELTNMVLEEFGKPDVIAGVATGGIPQGVLVAQELGVPFCYVRSSSKKHGLQNKVEGVVEPGQGVVVIEDLVSTGKSSLDAAEALRESDCEVKGMCAIFTYGFDRAAKAFEDAEIRLATLTDYESLIEQAVKSKYIDESDLNSLRSWRSNPETWKP